MSKFSFYLNLAIESRVLYQILHQIGGKLCWSEQKKGRRFEKWKLGLLFWYCVGCWIFIFQKHSCLLHNHRSYFWNKITFHWKLIDKHFNVCLLMFSIQFMHVFLCLWILFDWSILGTKWKRCNFLTDKRIFSREIIFLFIHKNEFFTPIKS